MNRAVILLALALSACGGSRVTSTPVPVACVKPEQIPAEPEQVAAKLTGNARNDVAVLAVSALELRDWGGQLRALLKGCGG